MTITAVPPSLSAVPQCGPTCVVLAWTSNAPATQWHLEQRDVTSQGDYVLVAEVSGSSYADTSPIAGHTYCYRLRDKDNLAWSVESCTTVGKAAVQGAGGSRQHK